MSDYYKENHFDEIFCYFFETYAYIHKTLKNIPKFVAKNSENDMLANFINNSISLIENSYNKETFDLLISTLYSKTCKMATNDVEREKIMLSNKILYLIYENNFSAFLDTTTVWSEETNEYLLFEVCPKLPVNWRKEYLKTMNIL